MLRKRTQAALSAVALVLSAATGLPAQTRTLAERLGHPKDAKLLIIHADDLGVAHSVDTMSLAALDARAATSASIMMPTPWVTEVAAYAKAHPDADLGLHLTLTSEWKVYRWGPLSPASDVPSLVAPDGTLWDEVAPFLAHAKPDDVERELRAQVERAHALGIRPTHLDSHMGTLFHTRELFGTYVKVAHAYRLPFLVDRTTANAEDRRALLSPTDVVVDTVVSPGTDVPVERWKTFYLDAVRALKPGLTEMIVHFGRDDAELQAVTVDHPPWGSAWRQRDYEVLTSPEFRKALTDNGVVLVRWRDLQKLAYQP